MFAVMVHKQTKAEIGVVVQCDGCKGHSHPRKPTFDPQTYTQKRPPIPRGWIARWYRAQKQRPSRETAWEERHFCPDCKKKLPPGYRGEKGGSVR